MKDRLQKLAMMKAKKKDGSKDPDAQPGFKPRPFMEKIKDKSKDGKKKFKPRTLDIKYGSNKGSGMQIRKMKDK
jgi:hypothetical protein